jgi:hypothetical protein
MDEPRLRVVRSDGNADGTASEPPTDEVPRDDAQSDADASAEENPWTSAFRGERAGHPSLQRPIPDRAEGRTTIDRRMRAYLHLVEGP